MDVVIRGAIISFNAYPYIRKTPYMITFKIADQHLMQQEADLYVAFCPQNAIPESIIRDFSSLYAPLSELIKKRSFTGAVGSQLAISAVRQNKPVTLLLLGLGSEKKSQPDRVEYARRAMGSAVRAIEQVKATHAAVLLPDNHWFALSEFELTKELVATAMMAGYHFDQFITDPAHKLTQDCQITLCAPALLHEQMAVGLEFGLRIGHGVNQARQWCDLPADVLTPTILANHAARIAQVHDLKSTIFTEEQIKKMGMGGLAGVAAGSAQECRFVVIEYKTEHAGAGHKDAPTIALTGKGITFDSGGISIKPANRMDEMKDDMAGAAAVISTMEAIAHLKPRVNVIGLAPIAENMPSGTAIKPGDILTFYNGKTAEVKNTDAEGRLILADALSYAVKHYKPDAIINIATLTGSCAAALGPFFAGMMSNHEDLVEKLDKASKRSGDRLWRLPFHDDYKKAVRSHISDVCNIGNETYRAGAITAGFFLQNFVEDTPWVHLDIAGTSFNVPDISYYRPGATGFGVRLFIDFLMSFK